MPRRKMQNYIPIPISVTFSITYQIEVRNIWVKSVKERKLKLKPNILKEQHDIICKM